MKNKSNVLLIIGILVITAIIAFVCYGNIKTKKNPVATMEVVYKDADGNEKTGTVKIELYPDQAPESVSNFIALANNGYYNGLTFHRILPDLVQGGDKEGTGKGSAKVSDLFQTYTVLELNDKVAKCLKSNSTEEKEIKLSELPKNTKVGDMLWYKDGKYQKDIQDYKYSIKGEFAANGINNSIKFEKGVIGMARSDYSTYGLTQEGYNSASSQFFITTTDDKASQKSLNQNYAAFGKVIEGYEYIEEIAKLYGKKEGETSTDTNSQDVPKMKSITIETFGGDYGLPTTMNFETTLNTVSQYQNYYQQLMSGSNDSSTTTVE